MKTRQTQLAGSLASTITTMLLAGLCTACNDPRSPAPTTYPVTGKVVFPGGEPAAGGFVQFQPESSPLEMQASGLADSKGDFSLTLLYREQKLPGALAGPHRVVVYMPLDANRSGGERYVIDRVFVVEPHENVFSISLPSKQP